MAKAAIAEQVNRCREVLNENHPDAIMSAFPGVRPPPGTPSFEALRQGTKQEKFMCLAAEAQLNFMSGCMQRDSTSLRGPLRGQDLEYQRREAKAENQELKADIQREQDQQEVLHMELARACAQLEASHRQCARQLHEAVQVLEVSVDGDAEAAPMSECVGELRGTGHSAMQSRLDHMAELKTKEPEEAMKRRRLQQELWSLEREQTKQEAKLAELGRLEEHERRQIESLSSMAQLSESLGLPRIEFDRDRGVVILGPADTDGTEPGVFCGGTAIRTVAVQHDVSGKLVRAEPHPLLQLWNEATTAVETDDLARLLTLVWDRLCEQSPGRRGDRSPCNRGGA